MQPRPHDSGLAIDLLAQRLVGAIAEDLCRSLGEEDLAPDLIADIYCRLRYYWPAAAGIQRPLSLPRAWSTSWL